MVVPAERETFHDLPHFFFGYRWIQNTFSRYRRGDCKLAPLGERRLVFPRKQFAAALMHLYVGNLSLAEIASMIPMSPAELALLRNQIDFMMVVDAAKSSFAKHFRQKLLLNEYPPEGYASMAAEHSLLEELVQNQIRFPLMKKLMDQARAISAKSRCRLPIDPCYMTDFKKLFSFFYFEESFLRDRETDLFVNCKRIAKEIVWARLGEDYGELDLLLSKGFPKGKVKARLKRLFVASEFR
jgi:hypothetical protein